MIKKTMIVAVVGFQFLGQGCKAGLRGPVSSPKEVRTVPMKSHSKEVLVVMAEPTKGWASYNPASLEPTDYCKDIKKIHQDTKTVTVSILANGRSLEVLSYFDDERVSLSNLLSSVPDNVSRRTGKSCASDSERWEDISLAVSPEIAESLKSVNNFDALVYCNSAAASVSARLPRYFLVGAVQASNDLFYTAPNDVIKANCK
jgi:hypothetical protein